MIKRDEQDGLPLNYPHIHFFLTKLIFGSLWLISFLVFIYYPNNWTVVAILVTSFTTLILLDDTQEGS